MNPGQFVPVLEDTHLIHKLDTAILENVCRDIRDALDKKLPVVPISINFSRLDFKLMDAVSVLEETVKKYNVPKQLLHVEITESALIDDLGALNKAIARLREQGYALWLDDFGSGYSSFNVLKDYEFDVLKIDMKFLSGFNENEKSRTLIKSVIDMADDIGMKTLTEGVETEEEMTFLKDAGCGRLQGYLFGKHLPRETLLEDIAKGKYVISDNTL
jgi:EAL domain-containing protein (putative c-di-GMP-specific phosphodiesterase class I)